MSNKYLTAFLSAAASCAHEMMKNAMFMEKEFPSIAISKHLRGAIESVCSSLVGTKHDIITELGEIQDLVEADASAALESRVDRVVRWLGEELPKLDAVVTSLNAVRVTDSAAGTAYLLVAGSAVNVMQRYGAAADAADAYCDSLVRAGSAPMP